MANYDNKLVEIIPKFKYRVAPKDRGIKRLLRRSKQLSNILFSKTFACYESSIETTKERYASDAEIEFYREFGKTGLLDEEGYILRHLAQRLPEDKNCLVVGCGTGREVFGVEQLGFKAVGIDNCARMIEEAHGLKLELGSPGTFECCDFLEFHETEKFDVVFLTYALLNHIQGRGKRVEFLRKAKALMKKGGYVVMHCDEFPANKNLRYHMASVVLRLRWFGKRKWQKGDTARSYLGTHCRSETPLFFHYYTSHYEVLEELQDAELMGWQFRRGWLIMDLNNANLPVC